MKTGSSNKMGFGLKIRLAAIFSCILTVSILAVVFFNVQKLIKIQSDTAAIQDIASRFSRLTTYIVDMETGERGYMLSGDMLFLEPYNIAEAEFEKYVRETEKVLPKNSPLNASLQKIASLKREWIEGPAIKEMMARRRLDAGHITHKEFIEIFKASNGKALTDEIRSSVDKVIVEQEKEIANLRKITEKSAKSIIWWAGVVILTVFGGFASIVMVARSVHVSIAHLIEKLQNVSFVVTDASSTTSEASTRLSQSNIDQAKSLESTASSLEQLTAMVLKNVENARTSKEVAQNSQKVAASGKESIEEMLKTIEDINTSNEHISEKVEESNKQVGEIVAVITEIKSKTQVIHDIVFQTRLLSFNASVEAARAGENGKGFAVVAEEVGNLAQMSGKAAHEISELIERSVSKVESIVENTKSSVGKLITEGRLKVEAGTKVARRCDVALEEIVSNVTNVGQMIEEITAASTEQAQGIKEINQAVSQLDSAGQTNVLTSQDTAKSAGNLLEQSQVLQEIVDDLRNTIDGAKKYSSDEGGTHSGKGGSSESDFYDQSTRRAS